MTAGLFVSFEGPEGSGKTTQIRLLAASLAERGLPVVSVREPGGTPLGERVRDLVLNSRDLEIQARAEALLFCAARAQLVEQVIRPALARDEIVLADRFTDSTRAYQGRGRGLDSLGLAGVLSFATAGLTPTLTILLDLPVEIGLQRRRTNRQEWNRLDDEALDYHRVVRTAFLDLAAAETERWLVLDAAGPPDDLAPPILASVVQAWTSRATQGSVV